MLVIGNEKHMRIAANVRLSILMFALSLMCAFALSLGMTRVANAASGYDYIDSWNQTHGGTTYTNLVWYWNAQIGLGKTECYGAWSVQRYTCIGPAYQISWY